MLACMRVAPLPRRLLPAHETMPHMCKHPIFVPFQEPVFLQAYKGSGRTQDGCCHLFWQAGNSSRSQGSVQTVNKGADNVKETVKAG
jgi:hypothetical protein